MTTTYNGWTNYETWLVNLWLTNDQGTAETMQELAAASRANDEAEWELADTLKEWVDGMVDESVPGNGMVRDLVNAALGSVDWREIARSIEA
jgi:hypothetical protein